MLNLAVEKSLTRTLGIGACFTSIFILWGTVTDPVNATKHFVLGTVAIGAIFLTLISRAQILWVHSKTLVVAAVIFLGLALSAVFNITLILLST